MRCFACAFALLAALPASALEQKYDDGKPDGSKSFADVGCGTWFDGPVDATCVRIHAARGKARAFDVAALDRDGNVLEQAAYDAAALPEQAGWAKLALRIVAEEGALIVVTFNEGEEGSLSWDKNEERHSTYFYGGNHHPFEEGNWMMRLSPGDGAKPLEFAAAELPAGQVVRADRGEVVELLRSDAGHAVRFERPAGNALSGFTIYAARSGRLARPFQVAICDDDLRVLRTTRFEAGRIGADEKWWALPMPPGPCPDAFWAVFDFQPTGADHVELGICRNPAATSAEARPGSVFRRAAPGLAWMVRAHFEAGDPPALEPLPSPAPADGAVCGDIAKKLWKAFERCDGERLASILAPDAPGFGALREDPSRPLDGTPHRKLVREVARDVGPRRATLVFAALDGPLLWDPPDTFRNVPEGPLLWLPDAPGRHRRPQLFALRIENGAEGWGLHSWEEFDVRDAAWGKGLLKAAAPLDEVLDGLAKARGEALAAIDAEIREMEKGAERDRLMVELAKAWAEAGEVGKWEAIAKELPGDSAAMLKQTLLVEGKHCIASGADEKSLRAAVELFDTLLPALEKRFGLKPEGRGRTRIAVQDSDDSGWVAHPWTWSYPEIVWFATEADRGRAPGASEAALALADACGAFWDDAHQLRRWIAAGTIAEAALAGKETPAALSNSVKDVPAARDTVEGHLRIFSEASKRWGDLALGKALAAARRDGARREMREGRLMHLDDFARELGKESGAIREVEELFKRP
ncbi:MAG: hypothetical protein HYY18_22250 [Planctomycetes bacterium]|nr:hypothetical protein [Planctomycetota bacterium]